MLFRLPLPANVVACCYIPAAAWRSNVEVAGYDLVLFCFVPFGFTFTFTYLDSADGLQPGAFLHSLANIPTYSNEIRNSGITYEDKKNETCWTNESKFQKNIWLNVIMNKNICINMNIKLYGMRVMKPLKYGASSAWNSLNQNNIVFDINLSTKWAFPLSTQGYFVVCELTAKCTHTGNAKSNHVFLMSTIFIELKIHLVCQFIWHDFIVGKLFSRTVFIEELEFIVPNSSTIELSATICHAIATH